MGMGQSARKLTISNEEEVGVIKVSNAVVHRLQTGQNEVNANDIRGNQPTHPTPPSTGLTAPSAQVGSLSGAPVYHYPEYTVSALEIQQQKEEELKNQDRYWQRRLMEMEKNHERVNSVLEAEYRKAIKEFSNGREPIAKDTKPPCLENSNKVLKCYQENPREALKCSNLVQEFSNCVDQRRFNLIAAR